MSHTLVDGAAYSCVFGYRTCHGNAMFVCQQPGPVGGSRQEENRQAMPPEAGHQDGFQNPTQGRVESTCSLQDFHAKFASCNLQFGSLRIERRS